MRVCESEILCTLKPWHQLRSNNSSVQEKSEIAGVFASVANFDGGVVG